MLTNTAGRRATSVRRLATVAAIAVGFVFATHAQAEGFVDKCQAFATAANEGKPATNADKICACIKGKLSESEQTTVSSALDEITAAGKSGKEPAEPAGEKKAALQKFMDGGDACSKDVK